MTETVTISRADLEATAALLRTARQYFPKSIKNHDTFALENIGANVINKALRETPAAPFIVIVLEGGLVSDILSDQPVNVAVIDYDTEGADAEDLKQIPQQQEGTQAMQYAAAFASVRSVDVKPERTSQLYDAVLAD